MIEYNKKINCRCICGKGLNWINKKIIMLEPCEHIIHKECFNNQNNKDMCMICNSKIEKIYDEKTLYKNKENQEIYQKYVDLISVKNFNYMTKVNKYKLVENIPKILSIFSKIPFSKGINDGKSLTHEIMNIGNVTLTVEGLENIPNGPKVIIANHTSDFDFIPLFYIFQSGFLSSSILLQSQIGKMISNIIKTVIVDRGKKNNNTVIKMRKHVEKYGSICLFPEGLITHPDTIIRFRSGAFNIGYPISPVVLIYEPVVYDSDIGAYMQKLLSQEKFVVKMKILPPEFPPFTEQQIEKIRNKMAKAGNFAMSRVINKDIRDK